MVDRQLVTTAHQSLGQAPDFICILANLPGTSRYLCIPHESQPDVEVQSSNLILVAGVPLSHGRVVRVSNSGHLVDPARVEGRHRVSYRVRALENCAFAQESMNTSVSAWFTSRCEGGCVANLLLCLNPRLASNLVAKCDARASVEFMNHTHTHTAMLRVQQRM